MMPPDGHVKQRRIKRAYKSGLDIRARGWSGSRERDRVPQFWIVR